MKAPQQLTPAEFEIIQILWRGEAPLSVADVRAALASKKSVAYTTVMTLLEKMARKGSLKRVRRGKAYLYSAAVEREEVLDFLVEEFAQHYFEGRRTLLRQFVVGEGTAPAKRPTPPEEMDICLL